MAGKCPEIPRPLRRPVDSGCPRCWCRREEPSLSARLSQFWSFLPSKAKVPPRAGGWRKSTRVGGVQATGGPRREEAAGKGLGAEERAGALTVRRVRRWARSPGCRSPVGLGSQAGEGREGGRQERRARTRRRSAPQSARLWGEPARGSGTCLRPCDPGAAPAAAPGRGSRLLRAAEPRRCHLARAPLERWRQTLPRAPARLPSSPEVPASCLTPPKAGTLFK